MPPIIMIFYGGYPPPHIPVRPYIAFVLMGPVYPQGYAGGYTHKKSMLHRLFRGVYPRIKAKKCAKI